MNKAFLDENEIRKIINRTKVFLKEELEIIDDLSSLCEELLNCYETKNSDNLEEKQVSLVYNLKKMSNNNNNNILILEKNINIYNNIENEIVREIDNEF